jgi:putative membrane-bound dehydrogenase-like protein
MKRLALAFILLAVAGSGTPVGGRPEPKETPNQIRLNGHTFTLPAGFEIELVAGPPLVNRPIVADFDERGRLYVADSSGSNDRVEVQLKDKPHRIVRLESSHGDGRFDRRTIFADKMMFPEGAMWHHGSLYVAAPPSIWKLTDADGDGVAEKREEWFQGKTLTGCANDLHGPYLGPDGWIYWCKGAFAQQTYERPGKKPFVTKAAHVFRCRPDGSGLEPVMTGGMDNPVELVFSPGGERFFTTTFFQHPGGGFRDGLVHAIYGGVYGKDHAPIYDHPWTGPDLMPVLTHLGPAAPAGLVRYESAVFGPDYQNNLFAALFNLHKVTRHVLEPSGATFKSRDEDFLVSDNLDFHPTDVLEDADGSLLVIDTGGWYKLCCPTSQLHKPDILGAIYRVRRKGAAKIEDPRGLKLAWEKMAPKELVGLLEDSRPAVRKRAVQTLAERGGEAVPVLAEAVRTLKTGEGRCEAVWAATRIDRTDARAAVRQALTDPDETVRQAALHSVSVWRDHAALPRLLELLQSASLPNRRAAAEALGRLGDRAAVPALLAAAGQPADRVLEHSLTYALIEIADPEGPAAGLQSSNLRTRRAALAALDQMGGNHLPAKTVAAELASADARMKETAWWIAGRHPEWAGTLTPFLRERLAAQGQSPAEHEDLARQLAKFARASAAQDLLAERLGDATAPVEARRTVLQAMAQAGLREAPESWIVSLTRVLGAEDPELVSEAAVTARSLRIPPRRAGGLSVALLRVGDADRFAPDVRLSALAALPATLAKIGPALFTFLREQLDPEKPVATRSLAADVLSRAHLTTEQLLVLTRVLKTAGPMEMDRLLEPFAQSTNEEVGHQLLAALIDSSGRSNLRVNMIQPRLAKYSPAVQKEAEELYAVLDVDAAKQQARLEELLSQIKDGDVRRGQAIFHSSKAACYSCHAIGYRGGNVGPDLTRIGRIRTERDLLESIVFPSASIVRSYEPVQVTTKSGKVYNGLIRKETPEEIVLATGPDQEARVARSEIEDVQPSKISVMPAGLDQQLSVRDLADLVAFLKACK